MLLMALSDPSGRAFGGCLAASLIIGLLREYARRGGRTPRSWLYKSAWVIQLVLVVAAVVFLYLKPLG